MIATLSRGSNLTMLNTFPVGDNLVALFSLILFKFIIARPVMTILVVAAIIMREVMTSTIFVVIIIVSYPSSSK